MNTTIEKQETKKPSFVNLKQAKAETEDIIKRMQSKILETKSGSEFKSYLSFLSRQTSYSFYNTLRIWAQGGNFVKGGKAWKKEGREVVDWNNKIWILAPCIKELEVKDDNGNIVKDDNGKPKKESRLIGFKEIYVFDSTNTKGKPLPVNPLRNSWELDETDKGKKAWSDFVKAMEKHEISLEFFDNENKSLKGSTNGKSIKIHNGLTDHDKFLTGIHELAHYLLHFNKDRSTLNREVKELQAESVAYVISEKFGLKSNSIEYCALYHHDHDLMDSLKAITTGINTIMNMLTQK